MSTLIATVLAGLALAQAQPPTGQIQRGRARAQRECAACHAIGATGVSTFGGAPPFRELHRRYPVENLAEALAEGIMTAHPAMPEFQFEPAQIDDFIAYLKSLEWRPALPRGPKAPLRPSL